jgi:hypothetical protein
MYFDTKSYLKSTRNHTTKHARYHGGGVVVDDFTKLTMLICNGKQN